MSEVILTREVPKTPVAITTREIIGKEQPNPWPTPEYRNYQKDPNQPHSAWAVEYRSNGDMVLINFYDVYGTQYKVCVEEGIITAPHLIPVVNTRNSQLPAAIGEKISDQMILEAPSCSGQPILNSPRGTDYLDASLFCLTFAGLLFTRSLKRRFAR